MIGNWKVTARLSSPLAGEPPALDALLEWEMSFRLGMKRNQKLTRSTPLSEIPAVPVPLAKRTIFGHDVYACSNPIIPPPTAEWVSHTESGIDPGMIVQLIEPKSLKCIVLVRGPYKARISLIRIRSVDRVCWFFRGDNRNVKKILKSVLAIGKYRGIGYGFVSGWEFEDMGENDYSIFAPAPDGAGRVLMKTIPNGNLKDVTGYTVRFGGGKSPYWHPENYMEIAVPY